MPSAVRLKQFPIEKCRQPFGRSNFQSRNVVSRSAEAISNQEMPSAVRLKQFPIEKCRQLFGGSNF
jgi:hypothetical protein